MDQNSSLNSALPLSADQIRSRYLGRRFKHVFSTYTKWFRVDDVLRDYVVVVDVLRDYVVVVDDDGITYPDDIEDFIPGLKRNGNMYYVFNDTDTNRRVARMVAI